MEEQDEILIKLENHVLLIKERIVDLIFNKLQPDFADTIYFDSVNLNRSTQFNSFERECLSKFFAAYVRNTQRNFIDRRTFKGIAIGPTGQKYNLDILIYDDELREITSRVTKFRAFCATRKDKHTSSLQRSLSSKQRFSNQMIEYRNSDDFQRKFQEYNKRHQENLDNPWSNNHVQKNAVKRMTDDLRMQYEKFAHVMTKEQWDLSNPSGNIRDAIREHKQRQAQVSYKNNQDYYQTYAVPSTDRQYSPAAEQLRQSSNDQPDNRLSFSQNNSAESISSMFHNPTNVSKPEWYREKEKIFSQMRKDVEFERDLREFDLQYEKAQEKRQKLLGTKRVARDTYAQRHRKQQQKQQQTEPKKAHYQRFNHLFSDGTILNMIDNDANLGASASMRTVSPGGGSSLRMSTDSGTRTMTHFRGAQQQNMTLNDSFGNIH